MNIIPGDDSMTFEREIHRGKIFYMTFKEQTGSERQGGRPVIVVSNETCNKFSPTVTVVPLTTKDKKSLPTHVELNVEGLPVYGTILCEQVQSVSHYRLGSYVGEVDDRVMRKSKKHFAYSSISTQSSRNSDSSGTTCCQRSSERGCESRQCCCRGAQD